MLGDVMTDVVARLAGPLVPASDSPARITSEGGGASANTASWLAGLGARAVLLGRVGDDPAGRAAADALRSAGVEVRFAVDPALATGTVMVLVDPGGERTMIPDAGANASLVPQDLPPDVFAAGRHLHLSGYTLLRPGSRAAGLAALESARAAGMTVSVDAASVGPLGTVGAARFLEWVDGIDVLFANRDEAAFLSGLPGDRGDDVWAATRALAGHCELAVVKLGAHGAAAYGSGGAIEHVDAVKLDPGVAVDSTGAGDAFAAGFLHGWLGGLAVREALRSGCSLAARAVGSVGARPTATSNADGSRSASETGSQPRSSR
jgi:sugar/nucleoside kinase (ribokinase family)